MGVISPLGHSVEETWANIKAGVCGIAPITRLHPGDANVRIAAEVKNWIPHPIYGGRKEARKNAT